jgi:hypothetical protein
VRNWSVRVAAVAELTTGKIWNSTRARSAVGDPACDLTLAWTVFDGESRQRFMRAVLVDDDTWARARGWALWKAVVALPTLPEDDPRNDGSRCGWRWTALGVVNQITTEFRGRH